MNEKINKILSELVRSESIEDMCGECHFCDEGLLIGEPHKPDCIITLAKEALAESPIITEEQCQKSKEFLASIDSYFTPNPEPEYTLESYREVIKGVKAVTFVQKVGKGNALLHGEYTPEQITAVAWVAKNKPDWIGEI